DHQEQCAQGQSASLDVAYANENNGSCPQCGGETHHQAESLFGVGGAYVGSHTCTSVTEVPLLFVVFLSECLHDTDGCQHFLYHRKGRAFDFFHSAPLTA